MQNPEQYRRSQKAIRTFSAMWGFPLPHDPTQEMVWYRHCNNVLFDRIDNAHGLSDHVNHSNAIRDPDRLATALNNLTTHCLELSSIGAASYAARFGHRLLHDVNSENPLIRQSSEAGLRILKDAANKGDSDTSFFLFNWYQHRAPKHRMERKEKAKRYLTQAAINNHRKAAYIFARGVSSGLFVVPEETKDEIALGWFTKALAKKATGSLSDVMVRSSLREIKKLVSSPAIDPRSKVVKKAKKILRRYEAG